MAALCRAKSQRSDSDSDLSWSDSPQPPQKVSSKRMSRNSRRDKNQSPGQGITVTLYKTELCKGYSDTGYCRYGSKCRFAHGGEDLRPVARHKRYKTERCKNFSQNGSCPYGVRCRFIHFDPVADAQLASDPSTSSMLSDMASSPKRAPLSPGQGDDEHSASMTGTPTTPTTPSPSYQSLLGDAHGDDGCDGSDCSGRSSGRPSFSNSPSLSLNGTPMSVSSTSTPLSLPFTPQASSSYSTSTASPGSLSSLPSAASHSPAFSASSSSDGPRAWNHVPVLSLGHPSPSPSASASMTPSASTPSHPAPPPGFPPLPMPHANTNIAINPRLRRPSLDRSRSMNDVHDYVEFALQYDYDYQYGHGGDYHAHTHAVPSILPPPGLPFEMQSHPTSSQMHQSPPRLNGEVGVEVQVPSRSPSASPFPSPFCVPMTATAALNNNDRFASSARRLFSSSFSADPLFPSFEVSNRLFAASSASASVASPATSFNPSSSMMGSPASFESPMNLNGDFGLMSLGPDVHTQAIDSMLKDPVEESEQSSKPHAISNGGQGSSNGNGNGGASGSSLNSRLPFFSSLALDNRADLLNDDDFHTHSAPISLSLRLPRSTSTDAGFTSIRV